MGRTFHFPVWQFLVLGLLVTSSSLSAHELTEGVGTQTFFRFFPDHVRLDVNLGYSAPAGIGALYQIDTDRDGQVDKAEKAAFLEELAPRLAADLKLHLNGQLATLELGSATGEGMLGPVASVPFDTWFTYTAPLPRSLPGGGWWMHYHDGSFTTEQSSQFQVIGWRNHHPDVSWFVFHPQLDFWVDEIEQLRCGGREAAIFFDTKSRLDMLPGQTPLPTVEELQQTMGWNRQPAADEPDGDPEETAGGQVGVERNSSSRWVIIALGIGGLSLVAALAIAARILRTRD